MSDARSAPRTLGAVGRALLLSAAILLVLAVLFFAGVFSMPERTRTIIAATLAFTAVADAGLGMFFLTRSRS